MTEKKELNSIEQAMREFTDTKVALAQAKTEIETLRNDNASLEKKLGEWSSKYHAYKNLTDGELKKLREERDYVAAYNQGMLTRLAVIQEIITVVQSDAHKYAQRTVRGEQVQADGEDLPEFLRERYDNQVRSAEEPRESVDEERLAYPEEQPEQVRRR